MLCSELTTSELCLRARPNGMTVTMDWPTPQEFNEALQNPRVNFADEELKGGRAELSALGLPAPITGAFASVYKMRCGSRNWAVRCFLHEIKDQEARYKQISKFVLNDDLVYTVTFDYQREGIRVGSEWYPILKMEWVDGIALEQYVTMHYNEYSVMDKLLANLHEMMQALAANGIAHGDLQHGNIIMVDGEFRLVDYDGMYVPDLEGLVCNELGHPNFQHPRRNYRHFGPYLDNFAAWTIHTSLVCVRADKNLWDTIGGGDDCLLFRRSDFRNPAASKTFLHLLQHESLEVRQAAELLQRLTDYPLKQVPPLSDAIRTVDDLPPVDRGLEELEESPDQEGEAAQMQRLQMAVHQPRKQKKLAIELLEPLKLETMTTFPEWMEAGSGDSAGKRMADVSDRWPSAQDYVNAARQRNFDDTELRYGVLTDYFVGANAVVLQFHCLTRKLAVKCYFKHAKDRELRYTRLCAYIRGAQCRYFVPFSFQKAGIRVGPFWYPVLKMEWASGVPFRSLAAMQELRIRGYPWLSTRSIERLRSNLRLMLNDLQRDRIVHGDLEPRNIFVMNDRFKLVDYDSMWIPTMDDLVSPDNVNPDYQHPQRLADPTLCQNRQPALPASECTDNFSAWILDLELLLLGVDIGTFNQVDQWGYKLASYSMHPDVKAHSKKLAQFARMPEGKVPKLDNFLLRDGHGMGGLQ